MSPTITALSVQKRNPNRVNIHLDGVFAFGLSRFVAGWLTVGQELTAEKIEELKAQDTDESALQRALNYLGYRPRSEAEVRQNLQKKGYVEPVIASVLSRLLELGLLNDAAFAQSWVENRSTFRPRSRRALSMELRQHGLTDEVIQEALEQTEIDDELLAYQAALKQSRRYASLDRKEFLQKMSGYLGRRGFSYEVARTATERVWQELTSRSEMERFPDEDNG